MTKLTSFSSFPSVENWGIRISNLPSEGRSCPPVPITERDGNQIGGETYFFTSVPSLISFLAVNQLGMSAKAVADKLGITSMAVGKCANRAEKRLATQQIIAEYLK